MARQFTLGKNERLKSRKQIEQLFKDGKTISVSPFHIYYWPGRQNIGNPAGTVQFGVGVGSRHFKRAVDRNRIKRLIREAYRLQKQDLYEIVKTNNLRLNVFIIYTAKELPGYDIIYERMAIALRKISSAIGKEPGK